MSKAPVRSERVLSLLGLFTRLVTRCRPLIKPVFFRTLLDYTTRTIGVLHIINACRVYTNVICHSPYITVSPEAELFACSYTVPSRSSQLCMPGENVF